MKPTRLPIFLFACLLVSACTLLVTGNLEAQRPLYQRHPHGRTGPSSQPANHQLPGRSSRSIEGPMLGFLWDGGPALVPVAGLPGAAVAGRPLLGFSKMQSVSVAPRRDYAIAISLKKEVFLDKHLRGLPVRERLGGPGLKADEAVLSPTGAAVALWNRASGEVIVFQQVPEAPRLAWRKQTLPDPGPLSALAVSDDGEAVLAAVGRGSRRTVIVLRPGERWRYLAAAGAPVGLSFLANREDGVFTDGASSEVFLVQKTGASPAIRRLAGPAEGISHPVAVATALDNRRVLVANGEAGGVAAIDLDGSGAVRLACAGRVTGLERMNGNFVFRLRQAGRTPVRLFDGDAARPRIVLVPPPTGRRVREGGSR